MPLNDVIFEQTKLQKLDWAIMNMFQSQSVNIYGKRANARGGALCAPPHQPSMKKSPSGLGLRQHVENVHNDAYNIYVIHTSSSNHKTPANYVLFT